MRLADDAQGFPPWQTVYWWFRRFVRRFLFETIHDMAVMNDRQRAGREASPSADILDSQTIKPRTPRNAAMMQARAPFRVGGLSFARYDALEARYDRVMETD